MGLPVRFNMPFELGLACAIKAAGGNHDFLVIEKVPHRLDRHLSDLRGIDPKIHHGTAEGAVCAVLDVIARPGGNPDATAVMRLYRAMRRYVPTLKRRHRSPDLFNPRIYHELVALGFDTARSMGL